MFDIILKTFLTIQKFVYIYTLGVYERGDFSPEEYKNIGPLTNLPTKSVSYTHLTLPTKA